MSISPKVEPMNESPISSPISPVQPDIKKVKQEFHFTTSTITTAPPTNQFQQLNLVDNATEKLQKQTEIDKLLFKFQTSITNGDYLGVRAECEIATTKRLIESYASDTQKATFYLLHAQSIQPNFVCPDDFKNKMTICNLGIKCINIEPTLKIKVRAELYQCKISGACTAQQINFALGTIEDYLQLEESSDLYRACFLLEKVQLLRKLDRKSEALSACTQGLSLEKSAPSKLIEELLCEKIRLLIELKEVNNLSPVLDQFLNLKPKELIPICSVMYELFPLVTTESFGRIAHQYVIKLHVFFKTLPLMNLNYDPALQGRIAKILLFFKQLNEVETICDAALQKEISDPVTKRGLLFLAGCACESSNPIKAFQCFSAIFSYSPTQQETESVWVKISQVTAKIS